MQNQFKSILMSLSILLFASTFSKAQIGVLKDYQNTSSPTIGTFMGVNFREGGFSGMYPIPNTNGTEFWVLSDRGVNVDCGSANLSTCRPTYDKMYSFPTFSPSIYRIRLKGNEVEILKKITIKRPDGTGATGLLNPTGFGSTATEVPSTDTVLVCSRFSLKTAAKDIWGTDPEGIAVDKQGNFWICEEGGPTIWKLNSNGVVLNRFTPYANQVGSQPQDIYIDSVFKYRKNNRGFEGLSITPNGKIYAMIQSPILYPTQSIGEGTRVHRILEIDPSTNATRMYAYLNDGIIGASGSNQIRLRDWKIGDMAAVNDSTFLVLEAALRGTGDKRSVYLININGATNVSSGLYSGKTLEALVDSAGLASNGIKPVKKKLFMDLLTNGWDATLDKAEGLAIINDSTISICNDNDFGQTCPLANGIPIPTSITSHVLTFRLKGSNKITGYQSLFSTQAPKLDYTFVMTGCNRAEPADTFGNPSTANVYQLNRMFKEVSQLNPLPKYLFFAGDMVLGYEKDTVKLAKQLNAWLNLYKASPLFGTSVQLVAIEGNHETQDKSGGKLSFPAAERTYLRVMGNYILGSNGPTVTGLTPGTDSLVTDQSKLTYSFDFNNDHFVVVNTDPVGRDGKASYKWITNDIKNARSKGARHIFAVGHKPAYTGHFKAVPDGLDNNKVQRDSFWTNMEKYQADAFFSAHMHVSDTIHPHDSKTWQVIAGNGGSLVEPTFTTAPNGYFGYVIVSVWGNDSVDVKNMGRDAVMTAGSYAAATPGNPTTLRTAYNIHVNPTINHIPYNNTTSKGPFTVVATIKDNISVSNAQLNYNVNGDAKTALTPTISGSTYTFVIPVQADYGIISYNIQANDVSGFKIYSTGASNKYTNFSFGPISQTGLNSSQSPYIEPFASGVKTTAIMSAGDSIGNYKMAGIPDGLGAYDNNNGTFTLLMNHEIPNSGGIVRAHGSKGAFVSKWVINKSNLTITSGSDLIKKVKLWKPSANSYFDSTTSFNRFCAGDLPLTSAFFNSTTGFGTQERIYLNGEEAGAEGRAFAHIATGTNAGTTYELPSLGKFSWENAIASPYATNKTVVAGTDDATPGQVYFYIGTKTNSGTEIEKAGLTGGKLFGVAVSGLALESSTSLPLINTTFSLIDLGQVQNMTGSGLQTTCTTAGVTQFLRPEDGAWDPSNPRDFYFVTTNSFTAPSRLWRLRFNDIANPELGGTITAVLDGTEGPKMMDNMVIDNYGHILIQEDPGNQTYFAKIWQYTIATDNVKLLAEHNASRFTAGLPEFLTQDEESSGIIDMQAILGAGMFLCVDQAHYSIPGEIYEGGQLLSLFNPDTKNSTSKISVTGNNTPIALGDDSPSFADNTDFGDVMKKTSKILPFEIKNGGPGELVVKSIRFDGYDALDFSLISPTSFPFTIAANSSQTINVQFEPKTVGGKVTNIIIFNNDFDKPEFEYILQGFATANASIANTDIKTNHLMVYPNPNNTGVLTFSKTISLEIVDYTGRIVKTATKVKELNISELSQGIYFLKTSDGETKKFIVQ